MFTTRQSLMHNWTGLPSKEESVRNLPAHISCTWSG